MNAPDDYCELCDLPKTQCPHGQPPPPPKPAVAPRPKSRKTPVRRVHTSATPEKQVIRRRTPPESFKPLILAVLEQADGELEADEMFLELEILAGDQLLPEDGKRTPEGELRWQYAARRARMALIDEGLMTKSRPGVWQLAPGFGRSSV